LDEGSPKSGYVDSKDKYGKSFEERNSIISQEDEEEDLKEKTQEMPQESN